MINLLLLLVGFVPLIFGADLLVDNASRLAKRLRIAPIVIGLTIVAFGTSSPELVVNLAASAAGSGDIAFGNIVGSSIFNILFILGLSVIVRPIVVQSQTTWVEIPLTVLSAVVLLAMSVDRFLDASVTDIISRSDGIVLLAFFVIFLAYTFSLANGKKNELAPVESSSNPEGETKAERAVPLLILLIILGFGGLVLGGRIIVDNAVEFARAIGISERVIALTIVSAGTGLPELATSVLAARKGESDIAIGNVVGSNLFNLFLILGLSAVIQPISVSAGAVSDLLVNILASLLLFVFVFTGRGRKLERPEGLLFLLGYIGYVVYLLV